jgi:hypothetical protein
MSHFEKNGRQRHGLPQPGLNARNVPPEIG